MKKILLLFLLLQLASAQSQRQRNGNGPIPRNNLISVISAEPRNGTIIKQGDSVRLSCRTNIQWFFCVWQGPDGDKQCAIQEKMPQNVCEGDNRITLEGGPNNCDIVLRNVKSEDFGTWMCLVTDPVNFNSDKTKIALEVGSPANVKFSRSYGQDNTLVVTEGDSVSITCEALNAHPAPQLSWVEPMDAEVDISAQPEIHTYDQTADIRHTIKYKANLRDNNGEIRCIGSQVARDGRTVLYEKTATVKLRVEKLVLPVDNALTQKIGIISGVLLAVIFLILLMVFVIFAVCKRRRKRSRPPSSTGTEDTCSPEEPPIKPIWTTASQIPNGGNNSSKAAPLMHHHHRQHLNNALSQATVSTQSTGSNASWEDRSVGGEIEESVGGARFQPPPKLVHETHFEDCSDLDLPRTVLHHPDPSFVVSHRTQRPSYAGRPSSSMLEHYPSYQQARPQSAMDNNYYPSLGSNRRMPTPNGPMTTSVKSVFDCELGCFIEDHENNDLDSTKASPSKSAQCESPMTPTSPVSNISSRTSEPREV